MLFLRKHDQNKYFRFGLVNNNFLIVPGRIYQKVQLNYSSSSSEDEKHFAKKTDENEKSNEALKKLNNLLKTMIEVGTWVGNIPSL